MFLTWQFLAHKASKTCDRKNTQTAKGSKNKILAKIQILDKNNVWSKLEINVSKRQYLQISSFL